MTGEDEGLSYFLRTAANHRILGQVEEAALARKWKHEGDDNARHQLYVHNIRLVISIARNFINRGLPLEDLIQEGCVGLDRATRKFDPDKGFKFSTYASWWVRQATQRAVAAKGRTIRVPNQVSTRRLQIDSLRRENPDLTDADLAEALGCTVPQVKQAIRAAEVVASLDREFSSETQTLFDTLEDPNADDPAEVAESDPLGVTAALDALSPDAREIVELRFGIGREHELTPQEVADVLNVPVKTVQETLRQSLSVLRENLC